jgi:16S rRNA pseudouridine516 synthase
MRIDKILANIGYGSRKEVKKLLKNRVVTVNGETVTDAKTHVDPKKDKMTVYGEKIEYKEYIYLMMNKPAGVISATEDVREKTVIDLLEMEDAVYEPFPVGRLDKDTVGLLLLTNDGGLAHQLLSPKKHVPKTYYALVDGTITEEDKKAFAAGIKLDDGYVTKPAQLNILRSGEIRSEIELTITEGKFHQVKRMFEAVGKKVVYLKRLSMGPIKLDGDLAEGEYRELTDEEIDLLKNRQ